MNRHIEEVFADGNMTPVVRVGDQVRRVLPTGWRGSHAVLRHLERKGFPYSPRLIRADDRHEWLSFMPGESVPADLSGNMSDALVVQVGRMIRKFHDSMADFSAWDDVEWSPMIGVPEGATTICHNDIAPWNAIVTDGKLAGLIDWDLVHPAPIAWDLAYAAWRFAPLYEEDRFGSVEVKANRIALLLDAYALPVHDRKGFVDLIRRRAESAFDTVEVLGGQGFPGYARLYEQGLHWAGLPLAWLDEHRQGLIELIEPT